MRCNFLSVGGRSVSPLGRTSYRFASWCYRYGGYAAPYTPLDGHTPSLVPAVRLTFLPRCYRCGAPWRASPAFSSQKIWVSP
nr:hypothetical protein [uncultured Prevotella sp.]